MSVFELITVRNICFSSFRNPVKLLLLLLMIVLLMIVVAGRTAAAV